MTKFYCAFSNPFGCRLLGPLMLFLGGGLLITTALVGCSDTRPIQKVDVSGEAILFGGGRCDSDDECATRLCTMGMCLGFLTASSDATRDSIGMTLSKLIDAGHGVSVRELLVAILADSKSDSYVRGRAADAYRFVPREWASSDLVTMVEEPDEIPRFFAVRAMAVKGVAGGSQALASFIDHPSAAIRAMAREVVGDVATASERPPVTE